MTLSHSGFSNVISVFYSDGNVSSDGFGNFAPCMLDIVFFFFLVLVIGSC